MLGADSSRLQEDLMYAEKRYEQHVRNEVARADGKLPSDLDRYLKTGDCRD